MKSELSVLVRQLNYSFGRKGEDLFYVKWSLNVRN